MHNTNAITRFLPGSLLPCPNGIASKVQMLYLPALLHVIPGAVLHDALLVVWRDVGGNQQVFQLDLPRQDVDVFQQVFPLALEAALQVCCLGLLALQASLKLLQLLPFLLYFLMGKYETIECKGESTDENRTEGIDGWTDV